MNRVKIVNIFLAILCITAMCINSFFESYKMIGIGCILLMGILAVGKDVIAKKSR